MARINPQGNIAFYFVESLAAEGVALKTQVITRTATGGTVDITVAPGDVITGLAITASTTAAQIKTALLGSTTIDTGEVDVTGSTGGPFTVTGNIPTLDIDDTNATGGTVTVGSVVEAVGSDQYEPSLATHLTAANNITEGIRNATGWSFSRESMDVPDLSSPFPKTAVGLYTKVTPSLDLYRNDDPASRDSVILSMLPDLGEGFIVRSPDTANPEVGTLVEVWPVRIMSNTPMGDADATSATANLNKVTFAVTDVPDLVAPVVA